MTTPSEANRAAARAWLDAHNYDLRFSQDVTLPEAFARRVAEAVAEYHRSAIAGVDQLLDNYDRLLKQARGGSEHELFTSGEIQAARVIKIMLQDRAAQLAALTAKLECYKSALLDAQEKHIASVGMNAELRERIAALETMSPTERDLEQQVRENISLTAKLAAFDDATAVDEALCRAAYGEPEFFAGRTYWKVGNHIRIQLADEGVEIIVGLQRVLTNPTVAALNHLLAALREGNHE